VSRNGIMAMKLSEGDELISTGIAADSDEIILASEDGRVVKFKVDTLRSASRVSGGVHGIRPADGHAVGMGVVFPDAYLLTVTHRGFGKLTEMPRYSTRRRGGKGIRAHKLNEQTGKLAACRLVSPKGYLTMLSSRGNVVRIPIEQISKQSRGTKGVHLMSLDAGDSVVSITTLDRLGT